MTDEELYEFVSRSQEDGFKALFMQYQGYVYTIVWGMLRGTGSPQDAEDCVSEVFLQVFLHFQEIRGTSLKAYIGTVAKHKAIDYARKLGTVSRHGGDALPEDTPSGESVERSIEETEQNERLVAAVRSLGEPDASIVIGRYFYDRKPADIARGLHMTPVAVRVRLNRALRKLRKRLSDEDFLDRR